MALVVIWMFASLLALLIATLLLHHLQRADRLQQRIELVGERVILAGVGVPDAATPSAKLVKLVANFGRVVLESGLLSVKTLRELGETLHTAGFRADQALRLFIGCKILLVLILPVLVFALISLTGLFAHYRLVAMAAAAGVGLLLPDFTVRKLRARTLARLDAGLADALDLMVICAEAGLALEPTIARVGLEIRPAHPAMADELERLTSELQLISDPRIALMNVGNRTGLAGLKRLAITLAQSLQYGTPLGQSLRVLSAEMRQETLLRFEEKAAKLPVMLTLPMIVFILPTIFLVVGGPAAIGVIRTLSH